MDTREYTIFKPKRGSASEWQLINPILEEGEAGIEHPETGAGTGPIKIKIGDGVNHWNDLPYAIDESEATEIDGGTVLQSHKIVLRHGTTSEWLDQDPVLELGEPAFDITLGTIKVGDGIHKYSELRTIGEKWNEL